MRRTVRSVVLEVLSENEKGMSSQKISMIVSSRIATVMQNINSVLCQLHKDGLVRRAERTRCECCGSNYVQYKRSKL